MQSFLVALVLLGTAYGSYPPPDNPPTYPGDNPHSQGQGYPTNPHQQGSRYGGYRNPYYYAPPPPPPPQERPQDKLDKLYQRADAILNQLNTYEEMYEQVQTRISEQTHQLTKLLLKTLPKLRNKDDEQNKAITQLQEHLSDARSKCYNDLTDHLKYLDDLNDNNTGDQEKLLVDYAAARRKDIEQDGAISQLVDLIYDFKEKIFQVMDNKLQIFYTWLTRQRTILDGSKETEKHRKCETGRVTLDHDDRKATYVYQSKFKTTPGVVYGICGFNYDLDKFEDTPQSPYGYGPSYPEPQAAGIRITAWASETALNVEAAEFDVGRPGIKTVDVCATVCSIYPGRDDPIHPE